MVTEAENQIKEQVEKSNLAKAFDLKNLVKFRTNSRAVIGS